MDLKLKIKVSGFVFSIIPILDLLVVVKLLPGTLTLNFTELVN